MNAIQPYFPVQDWNDKKPYRSHLPMDLIKIILSYLDRNNLLTLSSLSKSWKSGIEAYFESSPGFSSVLKAKNAFENFVNSRYLPLAVLPLNKSDVFSLAILKTKPNPWENNHFMVVYEKAFAEIYLKNDLLVINRKNEEGVNPIQSTLPIKGPSFLGFVREDKEIVARELVLEDTKFSLNFKTRELTLTTGSEKRIIPSVNDIDLMGRDLLIATDHGLMIYDPYSKTSRILYSQKFTRIAADVEKGVIRGYNKEDCFSYELDFKNNGAQPTAYDKYELLNYYTKALEILQKVGQFFKRFGIGYFESAKGTLFTAKKYFIIGAAVITPILPIMGLIMGAALPGIAILLAIGLIFSLIIILAILNGVGLFIGALHACKKISECDLKDNFGS